MHTRLLLPLVLVLLCGACSRRKPHVVTGTLTTEQAESISRASGAIGHTFQRDNSVELWRSAVAKQTRRLVGEGKTDLQDVKTLVCQHTTTEETNARQFHLAWLDATKALAEATKTLSDVPPSLLAESEAGMKEVMYDVNDRSFTERRDALIEEQFNEAMKEASQQKNGH